MDYGRYIFLLNNGVLQEGIYDSFAHPHGTAIKVCYDYDFGYFDYISESEILGYRSVYEVHG